MLHRYRDILLGGFHIEEKVYGPKYYYPGINIDIREYEPDMPDDTMLVHLYAAPETIRARMAATPHPHSLVPIADIPEILDRFQQEVRASWIRRKFAVAATGSSQSRSDDLSRANFRPGNRSLGSAIPPSMFLS